jgi:hypothetical protein
MLYSKDQHRSITSTSTSCRRRHQSAQPLRSALLGHVRGFVHSLSLVMMQNLVLCCLVEGDSTCFKIKFTSDQDDIDDLKTQIQSSRGDFRDLVLWKVQPATPGFRNQTYLLEAQGTGAIPTHGLLFPTHTAASHRFLHRAGRWAGDLVVIIYESS